MSVNIRDRAIVESAAERLKELIAACRVRGGLYGFDPALTNAVIRNAKALATSLAKLRRALDDPDHQPSRTELATPQESLAFRLSSQPLLAELVRFISYGGKRLQDVRARRAEMAARLGEEEVRQALHELTTREERSGLVVLRPGVRPLCRQVLGPPPEDPRYEEYWRSSQRTPPADHQPPPPQEEATPTARRGRSRGR
jgi:hypothetical protein